MEIKKILTGLTGAFKQLVKANEVFSGKEPGAESFRALVDQRELMMEDVEHLTHELIKEINHIYRDNSFACKNLSEAVRALLILAPELSEKCEALKDSLSKLVESDKLVEKKISDLKDSVKLEINKVRKGSKVLKGYKQPDPMGSCFINKIK
jgi:hypothetical protein